MDPDSGTAGPLSALAEPVALAPPGEVLGHVTGDEEAPVAGRRYPAHRHRQSETGLALPSSDRLATLVHVATLIGSFFFWAWLDRGLWFFGDEWDFLVRRGLAYGPADPRSIWFPHNEHWSTLPILLWRALYNTFHLSSYWPYLVPLLLTGVGVMHIAWRLCRRAGVDIWVATAAVGLLGFLGAGAEDLTSAFQIGFVASVLFGLIGFDLLTRPGAGGARTAEGAITAGGASKDGAVPLWWDGLASLALLASLMCSAIGIAMVIGAAVLLFATRPLKRALRVLALPVVSYVIWFVFVGRLGLNSRADHFSLTTVTTLPSYVWSGLSSALGTTFNLEVAGTALLVGLAAWVGYHIRPLWRENPVLLGLFVSGVMFYAVAGFGRDTTGGANIVVSRYVYVGIAILLPVIAKVLSSAGTWPAARVAVIVLLAVTALGDVGQAQAWAATRVSVTTQLKAQLVATARWLTSGIPDVSGPSASPVSLFPDLSAGSVARLEHSGQLPHAALTAVELVNARASLAVGTWAGSKTALLANPLFVGRFDFVRAVGSVTSVEAHGCMSFSPESISPAMQVWLRVSAGERAASIKVSAPPASPGLTNYLAAVLAPPHGPDSTTPVELAVPETGVGYLSDNDPGTDLVLLWNIGAPLTLCGI
jgi:hypothetical protein